MPTTNDVLIHLVLDSFDPVFNNGTIEIRTGAAPGAANAATGTVLATIVIPADAFSPAAGRVKVQLGTWQDAAADASGTAGHARWLGGTSVMETSVTATGGGGELELNTLSIVAGALVSVTGIQLGSTSTGA